MKEKGEVLIPLLNNIKMRIENLSKNELLATDELDREIEAFLVDRGRVETLVDFYFGKLTSNEVLGFLTYCEGIHLKLEITLLMREIELTKINIENAALELAKAESNHTNIEDEDNLTIPKVKLLMAKQKEIEEKKRVFKEDNITLNNSMTRTIEFNYRLKKVFNTESLIELLNKTDQLLKNSIENIKNEYTLKKRFNNLFL